MANLSDVAREAGVSPTTVSRYLNKNIALPPATCARIDAAIAKLDYRPNLLAKRLSTGRTEAISLVTPQISNPFFSALAAVVEEEAGKHGYAVFLSSTRGEFDREIDALKRLRDQHVDGIIMMTNCPDDGELSRLLEELDNVVLLDEDVPGAKVPRVFAENVHGGFLAAQHLVEMGHERIAMITGPRSLLSVNERREGFERALSEAGLEPEAMVFGSYSREHGYRAAMDLLGRPDRPTAIFAASDMQAIGVLVACRELGLSVPGDVSLIGFDDIDFAALIDPALTTIRQPIGDMGRTAFSHLHGVLSGMPVPPLTRLPVELIRRQSVSYPVGKVYS